MSEINYSLKLQVGDTVIEAAARSQDSVQDLFNFALAKRKLIKSE
jgi:hypothetical protein